MVFRGQRDIGGLRQDAAQADAVPDEATGTLHTITQAA